MSGDATQITGSPAYARADPRIKDHVKATDEVLQRLDRTLETVEGALERTTKTLGGAAPFIPVATVVVENAAVGLAAIRRARQDTDSTVSTITGYLQHAGRPSRLEAVAEVWLDEVTEPLSGRMAFFSAGGMHLDDWWVGKAKDEYLQHLPLRPTHWALSKMQAWESRARSRSSR